MGEEAADLGSLGTENSSFLDTLRAMGFNPIVKVYSKVNLKLDYQEKVNAKQDWEEDKEKRSCHFCVNILMSLFTNVLVLFFSYSCIRGCGIQYMSVSCTDVTPIDVSVGYK